MQRNPRPPPLGTRSTSTTSTSARDIVVIKFKEFCLKFEKVKFEIISFTVTHILTSRPLNVIVILADLPYFYFVHETVFQKIGPFVISLYLCFNSYDFHENFQK